MVARLLTIQILQGSHTHFFILMEYPAISLNGQGSFAYRNLGISRLYLNRYLGKSWLVKPDNYSTTFAALLLG